MLTPSKNGARRRSDSSCSQASMYDYGRTFTQHGCKQAAAQGQPKRDGCSQVACRLSLAHVETNTGLWNAKGQLQTGS